MPDGSLVLIGRVVKAHGLRGEVVVDVLSDVPGRLDAGTEVALAGHPARIASSRPHQGRLLVVFEGVADRTAAELLRGSTIEAPPVDLDDAASYFVHELVGMAVRTDGGRELGAVSAAIELPNAAGYDLLEVRRDDGSTWLLPAVDDYVEVAEDEEGRAYLLLIDPPAGLVDEEPDVVRSPGEGQEPDA